VEGEVTLVSGIGLARKLWSPNANTSPAWNPGLPGPVMVKIAFTDSNVGRGVRFAVRALVFAGSLRSKLFRDI